MTPYIKIPALFKRDKENKKVVKEEFLSEDVKLLKENKWLVKEKIDGMNIGVVWDGYSFSYQGRTEKTEIPQPMIEKLDSIFKSQDVEEIFESWFGTKQVIIYGEGYGGSIQRGKGGKSKYKDKEDFAVFDIYFPEQDLFMKWEGVLEICCQLCLDTVFYAMDKDYNITYVTLQEMIDRMKLEASVNHIPESYIDDNTEIEGFVCIPKGDYRDRQGNRIIVKLKFHDFMQLEGVRGSDS